MWPHSSPVTGRDSPEATIVALLEEWVCWKALQSWTVLGLDGLTGGTKMMQLLLLLTTYPE